MKRLAFITADFDVYVCLNTDIGHKLIRYMVCDLESNNFDTYLICPPGYSPEGFRSASDARQVLSGYPHTEVAVMGVMPMLAMDTLEYMSKKLSGDLAGVAAKDGEIYYFDSDTLKSLLDQKNDFQTAFLKLLDQGLAQYIQVTDQAELIKITGAITLSEVLRAMYRQKCEELEKNDVVIINPLDVYIDRDVVVGKGTVIYPGNCLESGTVIGQTCILYPGNRISGSVIGNGVTIQNSVIITARIGDNTTVGPYAYLRPGSRIGERVRIGDFVEIKNSVIGDRSKCSHLSYVGDADVGSDVNIGCGVVFVNYDGKKKQKTTVANNAFIGSNSNLVAPVVIGERAYIAAGSTVTEDVPPDALCIARERQVVKPGWVQNNKNKSE
ncbi:MAG TPA: hypothetical protein PLZ84_02285 [Clostridia bacterium]|nr:hypothetical protein [Clostridia bacterium]